MKLDFAKYQNKKKITESVNNYNKMIDFDELTTVTEAYAPQNGSFNASPYPSVQKGPPSGLTNKLTNVARSIAGITGKGLKQAVTNPSGAASSLRNIRSGGINQAITGAINNIKKSYAQLQNKQLAHYYDLMDFPAGWPKTGSTFTIETLDNSNYIGKVISASNINKNLVLTVNTSKDGASFTGTPPRVYVIELDPTQRAYFSVLRVTVSDLGNSHNQSRNVAPNTYVKNEEESDPNYVINYNPQIKSFILKRNKTYQVLVAAGSYPTNLPLGARIRGKDLVTQRNIEGTVTGPMRQETDPNTKQSINVYPVAANFK